MFEDFGKSNLVNFLVLGAVGIILPRILPKVLPEVGPAVGTAVRVVIDLLTESEAEAAEELMNALVSGTISEINRQISHTRDPGEARQSVEDSVARFKRRARERAHRWGGDHDDRRRRYHRHLQKLQTAVELSKDDHAGWQRDILDDIGEIIE